MDPSVALVHESLAAALEEVARYDQAIEEYLAARTLSGEDEDIGELRGAYAKDDLQCFRQKQLQLALARWTGWHDDAFQIAALYSRLGDSTRALGGVKK